MSGKTAAMIAASNGNTEILKALGRGPSLLNLKDADGGTAAMTAAVLVLFAKAAGTDPADAPGKGGDAPETGGDAPEGGQQQVVVVVEGTGGKVYQDIDAPKSNRVVLDYGDI